MCTAHTSSILTDIIACPLPSKIRVMPHCSCLSSLHQYLGFQGRDLCSIGGHILPPAHSARYLRKYSLEATGARRQHLATPSTPLPQLAGSHWDDVASLPPAKISADPCNDHVDCKGWPKLGRRLNNCLGGRTAGSYTHSVRALVVAGWLCGEIVHQS